MKTHSAVGGDAIDMAMRDVLSEAEFEILRSHGYIGGNAPDSAGVEFESATLSFLAVAKEIAMWHHEKWDGSGYPDGLSGDDIPIPARLMALADVFDALSSRRIYKEPMPFDAAVRLIIEGSGKHFDPDIVDAFIANKEMFLEILQRHADTEESLDHKLTSMRSHGMV